MANATWLGKTIDHYEITEFLNRGGMAEIYLAKDTKLARDVCIKVMLPEGLQRPDFKARFEFEAQSIAQLDHSHIVRIYDIGTTETNQPYLVIEYISGGSLYDYLYPPPPELRPVIPPVQALKWTKEIAEALAHAHQQRIIHRDLKPGNILLRPNKSPVLADFGIAVVEEATRRITLANQQTPGTPAYMSPEQAANEKNLDGRSDIFSLGLILYELLAGEQPVDKRADLRRARPGLTDATYQVVETCRQHKPAKRYQTTADLIQALDSAIVAELTRPAAPPPANHRRRWQAGWVYGLGALLMILAIAAIVFWPGKMRGKDTAVSHDSESNRLAPTLPLTVIATDTQFNIVTVVASSTPTTPPTDTAVPPTDTITPTPEPATPTPSSLLTAVPLPITSCLTPTFFQTIWELRPQLGCATTPLSADFTYQAFEGGLLIWQKTPPPGIIYAIFNNGTWDQLPDPGGTAGPACAEAEQNGDLGPIFGFGTVWCSNLIWRDNLGRPTLNEQAAGSNQIQQFENGQIFTVGPAGSFILYSNGRYEQLSDATTPNLTFTTPTPATCLHQPAAQWATTHYLLYQDRFGCPLTEQASGPAAYQLFQNGLTVWSSHRDVVYVLYSAGDYAVYDVSSAIDQDYGSQLKGAFGWLVSNNPTVKNRLGDPGGVENVASDFLIQEYAGGAIFYFSDNYGRTYILLADPNVWTVAN